MISKIKRILEAIEKHFGIQGQRLRHVFSLNMSYSHGEGVRKVLSVSAIYEENRIHTFDIMSFA